jgi:hypothetical protein
MSKDYLEMMWARNKFQTRVLELGYAFLFTVNMEMLLVRIKYVALTNIVNSS